MLSQLRVASHPAELINPVRHPGLGGRERVG